MVGVSYWRRRFRSAAESWGMGMECYYTHTCIVACIFLIHCLQEMTSKTSIQYTIRGVPREVDQALRRRARERRISLNRLLIEELAGASGASSTRRFRSLKGLAGCWQE